MCWVSRDISCIHALVEGDDAGAAQAQVVLQGQPCAIHLALFGLAAQLPGELGTLRQAVFAEFAIGLVIVAITAAMVVSPPATSQTWPGAPKEPSITRILHDVVVPSERST